MIMKKYILLILFTFLCINGYSQKSMFIKGNGYTGYIFSKEHFVFMSIDNQKERYTPTKEDVTHAEEIIKDSIDNYFKKEKIHTRSIKQNKLNKYKRQYVGFITKNGDIVIYISFIKNIVNMDELSRDIITVCDGGEESWSIFINITKNSLYKVHINGVS